MVLAFLQKHMVGASQALTCAVIAVIAEKAMSSLQNSIILALRIGIFIIFFICSIIIWKYTKKKPLGMQTMLDPMLLELLPQSWTLLLISTIQFCISVYLYPIDEKLAYIITLTYSFFVCGFLLHNLFTGLIQSTYFMAANPLIEVEDETIGKIISPSRGTTNIITYIFTF